MIFPNNNNIISSSQSCTERNLKDDHKVQQDRVNEMEIIGQENVRLKSKLEKAEEEMDGYKRRFAKEQVLRDR